MAKDDYYVIVYKILAYLYVQLKNGNPIDEDMLKHDGILFQVNYSYWCYILTNMTEQGYIRGLQFGGMGKYKVVKYISDCEITPLGIDYLCENNLMEKANQFLKDIKDITPFI